MSHWYCGNSGSPRYTVKGKDGKVRDTTLRDARVMNLWPSVTTIMQVAASPGLDIYKQNQLLDASYNWWFDNLDGGGYFQGNNSELAYRREVLNRSKEHAKKASDRGTQIHDDIEKYLVTGTYCADTEALVKPAIKLLEETFPGANWDPERSFCSKLGFGGRVDLSDEFGIIIDFKTKDTDDIKKMVAYSNHRMQTAAYAVGLDMPGADRYNLFISTQVPGLLKLDKHEDFATDWGMFEALLKFWQLDKGYQPETTLGDFNVE